MIAEILEADFEAGREVFAVVGNAAQPAWDERGEEMRGFALLWERHGVMLDRIVLPRLIAAAGDDGDDRSELAGWLRNQNGRVAALAGDLARRAKDRDADGRWLSDFEELKRLFDAQLLREQGELVSQIRNRVAPTELAEMTREARSLRQARAA